MKTFATCFTIFMAVVFSLMTGNALAHQKIDIVISSGVCGIVFMIVSMLLVAYRE